jgi:hypothetical protein
MNPLVKAIRQSTGLTVQEFAEAKLNVCYQTFHNRLRKNSWTLTDIHTILRVTRMSFIDLFPDPSLPRHFQRVSLPRVDQVKRQAIIVQEIRTNTINKEEKTNRTSTKKQPPKVSIADDLPFHDVYSEGLQPL